MKRIKVLFGIIITIICTESCAPTKTATISPSLNTVAYDEFAKTLIAQAGGPEKVCTEANRMFCSFGFTNSGLPHFYLIRESDLKDYPALRSLGNVDGLWTDSPDYIKIHVGTRPTGFYIEIDNTNNQSRRVMSPGEIEIIKPVIFVHE